MTTISIQCPRCGETIAIAEAVARQAELDLRGKIESEMRQQLQTQQKNFEQATQERLTQEQAAKLAELQKKNQEQASQLTAFAEQQKKITEKEAALTAREQALEVQARKVTEASRKQIQEQVQKQVEEAHRLKDLEKDKTISDMKGQIDQLQQRVNQGSQQTQGAVGEMDLEQMLRQAFPTDKIERVKNTGDIVHTVVSDKGYDCGVILWESKNTQAWNNKWIEKALADQHDRQAAQVAIVSEALPKDVEMIDQKNGVWVIRRATMPETAIVLRIMVLELARAKFIQGINGVRMNRLRQYLMGKEFTDAIQRILSSQSRIKDSVNRQRQAMAREWEHLEKDSTLTAQLAQEITGAVDSILKEMPSPIRPPSQRMPSFTEDMPVAT